MPTWMESEERKVWLEELLRIDDRLKYPSFVALQHKYLYLPALGYALPITAKLSSLFLLFLLFLQFFKYI